MHKREQHVRAVSYQNLGWGSTVVFSNDRPVFSSGNSAEFSLLLSEKGAVFSQPHIFTVSLKSTGFSQSTQAASVFLNSAFERAS